MAKKRITEAASKKRGRPRKHDPEQVKTVARAAWQSRAKTPRQHQAIWFVQQAAAALVNRRTGKFVRGVEYLVSDEPVVCRHGVLEQLGRMLVETGCDKKTLIAHAREVNKFFAEDPEMTTRKAEKMIRVVRKELT